MSRTMLINARHADELRVAIVEDNVLEAYEVETAESGMSRGNIYRGVVAKVEPSLNAAFIEYGSDRHGFLPGDDVVPEAYHRKGGNGGKRTQVGDVLQKGMPILVQVVKEAVGQKGAALTTNLSIAGRYLVLTPYDDTRGVSRKVEDEKERKKLRKQLASFDIPDGCGVIARTNALDQLKSSLNRDLNALARLWKRLSTEAGKGKGPRLLYSDQDLVLQALRDFLDSTIEKVYVDDDSVFEKAEGYMRAFMPRAKTELIRYEDRIPLFARFHLDQQIDRIYDRSVSLPSGGSIVIDGTEALTAIDVNSGKTKGGSSHEDTVARTNVEAALEVARQLRMRDIGGLVVVDFIDMRHRRNHRKVEKTLRDAMKVDRARVTIGRISDNGLLEINRQRIKQNLQLRTHRECPTCNGAGLIASPEFVALSLVRRIEARAAAGDLKAVRIALHPELADGFQNSRRQDLAALEREFNIRIEIIAASHLHRSDEAVEWKRRQIGEKEPDLAPRVPAAALTASDLIKGSSSRSDRSRSRGRKPSRSDSSESGESRSESRNDGRKDGRSGRSSKGRQEARGGSRKDDRGESRNDGRSDGRTDGRRGGGSQKEARSDGRGDGRSDGRNEESKRPRRRRRRRRRGGGGKASDGAAPTPPPSDLAPKKPTTPEEHAAQQRAYGRLLKGSEDWTDDDKGGAGSSRSRRRGRGRGRAGGDDRQEEAASGNRRDRTSRRSSSRASDAPPEEDSASGSQRSAEDEGSSRRPARRRTRSSGSRDSSRSRSSSSGRGTDEARDEESSTRRPARRRTRSSSSRREEREGASSGKGQDGPKKDGATDGKSGDGKSGDGKSRDSRTGDSKTRDSKTSGGKAAGDGKPDAAAKAVGSTAAAASGEAKSDKPQSDKPKPDKPESDKATSSRKAASGRASSRSASSRSGSSRARSSKKADAEEAGSKKAEGEKGEPKKAAARRPARKRSTEKKPAEAGKAASGKTASDKAASGKADAKKATGATGGNGAAPKEAAGSKEKAPTKEKESSPPPPIGSSRPKGWPPLPGTGKGSES